MQFIDWALIPYEESLKKQLDLVDEVALDPEHPGYLIFCTHPPVVTLGRQTQAGDITTWTGDTIEISRGGRATYHGPSQLLVYAIVNIKSPRGKRGPQEIRGFLRDFETAIVNTLKAYDVESYGRSAENIDETGVWIDTKIGVKKMTSIGIAVKKWVTYHGAAINMNYDPKAFLGINPCGYSTEKMISIEELIGHPIQWSDFKTKLQTQLQSFL